MDLRIETFLLLLLFWKIADFFGNHLNSHFNALEHWNLSPIHSSKTPKIQNSLVQFQRLLIIHKNRSRCCPLSHTLTYFSVRAKKDRDKKDKDKRNRVKDKEKKLKRKDKDEKEKKSKEDKERKEDGKPSSPRKKEHVVDKAKQPKMDEKQLGKYSSTSIITF